MVTQYSTEPHGIHEYTMICDTKSLFCEQKMSKNSKNVVFFAKIPCFHREQTPSFRKKCKNSTKVSSSFLSDDTRQNKLNTDTLRSMRSSLRTLSFSAPYISPYKRMIAGLVPLNDLAKFQIKLPIRSIYPLTR